MAPGCHPQGIIIPVFHTSLRMAKTYSDFNTCHGVYFINCIY